MTNDPEDTPNPTGPAPVEDAPTTEIDAQQATELDLRPVPPTAPAKQRPVAGDTAEISLIATDEDDEVAALRRPEFPVGLRGYNTHAVDRYVRHVERCIDRFEEHTSPTDAVRRALDRVGEQTATVLREAERSAEETTRASRAKADDRVQRAEKEAAEIFAAAEARARSLDNDIERLWQERERLIDATRALADRLRAAADQAEAQFPPEAVPEAPEPDAPGPPPRPRASAEPGDRPGAEPGTGTPAAGD